ncbi:uncharacterized protein A4U43_C08F6060 [Asparagus officinalis]|uniref:uncharacterized protein LOC109822347 n=1 Tax=Asparagus officinalis TaxID=4686 RepID=UPI00098E4248|nr:uncharacterized protein LOC109822347 [Asparagus officinalis]ONK59402.1 uncharacterized protein A4U43_C08F6060 [Asparagus officinalis]
MGRKRKSEASRLDEIDRSMHSTFCSAANSLSQLYTQAMNQQKISFQAGERHGLEKVYQWILRQHEAGSRVAAADIVNHIQNELDYVVEDPPISPRLQFPHQNTGMQTSSGIFGQTSVGLAPRPSYSDQAKNSVFTNALSSPVRRSLQHYHLSQGGGSSQNGARNHDGVSRESNSLSNNDSSMDMHSDSPTHESY